MFKYFSKSANNIFNYFVVILLFTWFTSFQIQNKNNLTIEQIKVLRKLDNNFKYVASGTFMMGCKLENDVSCKADELPIHQVKLDGFYINKYEVTQQEWYAVMGYNPSKNSTCLNCPVEGFTWFELEQFLKKLNNFTGKNYGLPTEAEWEFCAKGGVKSENYSYSGSNKINNVAWYISNSDTITHEVGLKMPNELGLFDMSGNVWEWCSDFYNEKYYSVSESVNPTGPKDGILRVVRGGSAIYSNEHCLITYRTFNSDESKLDNCGFRLVKRFN
jgi:formylglycine-generating enzyme required for sulfatase activity